MPYNNVYNNFYISTMNTFTISYAYNYQLNFANNYIFSTCGKCMNLKTSRLIKKLYNSGCIGFTLFS